MLDYQLEASVMRVSMERLQQTGNDRAPLMQQGERLFAGEDVQKCQTDVTARLGRFVVGQAVSQQLLESGFSLGCDGVNAPGWAVPRCPGMWFP